MCWHSYIMLTKKSWFLHNNTLFGPLMQWNLARHRVIWISKNMYRLMRIINKLLYDVRILYNARRWQTTRYAKTWPVEVRRFSWHNDETKTVIKKTIYCYYYSSNENPFEERPRQLYTVVVNHYPVQSLAAQRWSYS